MVVTNSRLTQKTVCLSHLKFVKQLFLNVMVKRSLS